MGVLFIGGLLEAVPEAQVQKVDEAGIDEVLRHRHALHQIDALAFGREPQPQQELGPHWARMPAMIS